MMGRSLESSSGGKTRNIVVQMYIIKQSESNLQRILTPSGSHIINGVKSLDTFLCGGGR